MSVLSIVQIVMLVFDIIFFLVFGLCILFGFIKGWKKGILNLAAYLVPFLILLCFSGLFNDIILNINIPGMGSIKELISENIVKSLYSDGTPAPELVSLCESIAKAIINVVVYIAIIIVSLLLSYIIRIILRFTTKKFIFSENGGKKCAPSMKNRLFGLITGFANFLLLVVILFYPLVGIMNICDMATEDAGYVMSFIEEDTNQQQLSSTTDLFKDINEGINKSAMYDIVGLGKNRKTGVSIAGSYLGSLVKIKNNDVKVNLVQEYGRFRQILPIVSSVLESYNEENVVTFEEVQQEEIEAFTESIQKTNLLKLAAPAVREYLVYEIKKTEVDAEVIKKIEELNLSDEISKMSDVVVEIIKTGQDLVVDLEKPQDVLLIESLPNHISSIVNAAFKSDIINYILMPEVIKMINEELPEDFSDLKQILTEENIKDCLEKDVAELLTVYQNLAKYNNVHNFIFNGEDIDYKSDTALNNLETSIVKLFTLSLISGNEETLIKFGLDYANIEGLTYEALFNDVNVEWSKEIATLATTIKVALQVSNTLDLEENLDNITLEMFIQKDENGHYVLEQLLNQIADSEVFKKVIINYLESMEFEGDVKEVIDIIDLEKIKNTDSEEFRQEFVRLLEIFDSIVSMNFLNDEPIKLTGDSIRTLLNNAFDSIFIIGREDRLIEFALNKANVEGLTYEVLFKDCTPDWSKESDIITNTVAMLVDVINEHELDKNFNVESIVKKNESSEYIFKPVIDEIAKSELLRKVLVNYLESMEFEGDVKEVIDIIDLEKIKNTDSEEFRQEFIRLLEIFDSIVSMNFLNDEPIKLTGDSIRTLLNNAFDSIFIIGREDRLIEFALNKANVEGLTYEVLFKDCTPDWSKESDIITNTVAMLVDVINDNEIKEEFKLEILIKKDESSEYIFKPVIDEIAKSDLLKHIIVNYLESLELDEQSNEILDLLNISVLKDLSSESFSIELVRFLDIIDIVVEMNLLSDEEIKIDDVLIEKLILTVFESILIKGNEEQIINYILDSTGLKTTLDENEITLNFTDVDWEKEPHNLVAIFKAILNLGEIDSFDIAKLLDERTENTEHLIVDLIVAFGSSDIFGESVFDMMEKMVAEVGYEITFTPEEKQKIKENTWEVEVNNLLDLVDFCTEKLGDTESYNNISGAEITEVMTKASNTVIATKVLGTVLNEMLGKEYLAINPILDDGSYKYDFTNSSTLASTAKDIGALVDLKNNAQTLDVSNIENATENVENIVESIKILDESGLAKDMIQEVIGTDSGVNLDEVDLSKEADTIQKVYDVYKDDHENFDIDEHPELKEELEESDFAKTILDMLGINKK